MPDFGNASAEVDIPTTGNQAATQPCAAVSLAIELSGDSTGPFPAATGSLSCQPGSITGILAQVEAPQALEAAIDRFLTESSGNLNRPPTRTRAFDDFARGRLVTLLGIGLSQRQAAAALGVSHTAVQAELARRPELLEEVTAARFQAQVEPLLVVLRESKRSWRAATWLLNYLSRQVATREETPDEAIARAREEQLARRNQSRADEKEQKEYQRKTREREELRELNRRRAETMAIHGGPSPKERRAYEEEQRKMKELFEKLEAEADAVE
jgi:hypothetical protein